MDEYLGYRDRFGNWELDFTDEARSKLETLRLTPKQIQESRVGLDQ